MNVPPARVEHIATLGARDFVPARFPAGQKHLLNLHLPPPHEEVALPAVLVRGSLPGQTLVVNRRCPW